MSSRSLANQNLVLNDLTINGSLTLGKPLVLDSLSVTGDTSLNTLEASGACKFGVSTFDSTLQVIGATTLSSLHTTGASQLDTTLNVTGSTTLSTLHATGASQLDSTLHVNQASTLASTLNVTGATTLASTLNITGATTLGSTVNITGATTLSTLHATGASQLDSTLSLNGNLNVNSASISPTQLSYLSGSTSNIQTQMNTKANTASPLFSGIVGLSTSETSNYAYFGNDNGIEPLYYPGSTAANNSYYFGGITANLTAGNAELDFVNTGFSTDMNNSAFDWYRMLSTTSKTLLMRLYNNGGLFIEGLLNATGGITTTTFTATGATTLANVTSSNLQVNGNMSVTGTITGNVSNSNMEIVSYNLQGSGGVVTQAQALSNNTANNTNYAVFPSIYYGFGGSGGTYNASQSAGAIGSIVITLRTPSSFTWTLNKGTADNVNVFITFLVVYGVSNASGIPATY